jgi:glycosyltransferase involved in cell wall biosynthesis
MRRDVEFDIVTLQAKVWGAPRLANGLRVLRALNRLFWLMREKRFDAIVTLTHYSNLLGIPIAWLARIPVRVSNQQNTLSRFPGWFLRLDAWLANSRLADFMVACSEETRRFSINVEGIRSDKILLIPNGADLSRHDSSQWPNEELEELRRSLGVSATAKVVTTVGRLHIQKGHTYLIKAASQILDGYPDVMFLLLGDGEERPSIERQIEERGLSEHFVLLGSRRDVPRVLALSDLFVLPSIDEGLPLAVLEAMAARLAVVATDVDGSREAVVDGETGLLVPKADANALAQGTLRLLADEARRHEMGLKGYQRANSRFSERAMCEQYEKLILSVFARKSSHAP